MGAMQHYHLYEKLSMAKLEPIVLQLGWRCEMSGIVKSTLLGLGFAIGACAAAQAQSVASLPPNGGNAPTLQSAVEICLENKK